MDPEAMDIDVDSEAAMQAMMGFSSFGSQKPGKSLSLDSSVIQSVLFSISNPNACDDLSHREKGGPSKTRYPISPFKDIHPSLYVSIALPYTKYHII